MSPTTPDWKEEAFAAFVANHARQEALTRKQRLEAGEFSIELERAADDPPVGDPEFQKGLSAFGASLRAADVPFSQMAIAMDAVDAHGYQLPEFIVAIKTMGPPTIAALAAVAGAWVQARYGRKTRIKIGEVEAEARTVAEIEALLKLAEKYQSKPNEGPTDVE